MSSYRRRSSYARSWSRGRSTSARRPYKKRNVRAPAASRKRLRAIANLRTGGFLGIETKYFDVTCFRRAIQPLYDANSVMPFGTAGSANSNLHAETVYWLNCPGVGSNATQRDGRVITNRSIEIMGTLEWHFYNAVGITYSRDIMICLVLDTQVNAGPSPDTAAAIYQDLLTYDANHRPYLATCPRRNLENGSRFRVLATKRHSIRPAAFLGETATAVHISGTAPFRFFRRLGFKTTFQPSSTTVAESAGAIIDNGLYMIAFYGGATLAANNPILTDGYANNYIALTATARLRFVG